MRLSRSRLSLLSTSDGGATKNNTEVRLETNWAVLTVWLKGSPPSGPLGLGGTGHHHHHHHPHYHSHGAGPRFNFVSKANPGLGLRDTSLVEFTTKVAGKTFKTSMDTPSANARFEETDISNIDGLKGFGPKALTVAAELPEMGQVLIDFALSTTDPSLIMRVRCPSIVSTEDLRLDDFVLFDGDAAVSRGPRKDGRSFCSRIFSGKGWMLGVVGLAVGIQQEPWSSDVFSLQRWGFTYITFAMAVFATLILSLTALILLIPFFRLCWDYMVRVRGARRVFVNGWNAWSFTGTVQQGDRPPSPGMPGIFSAAFHHGAGPADFDRGSKELFSEMFALLSDKLRGTGLLMGFLSQHEQFGAFSFDSAFVEVGAHCGCDGQLLPPGSSLESDWCLIELQPTLPEDPLAFYMERCADVNHSRVLLQRCHPSKAETEKIPVGWCSWYHFYENISEKNLQENITMMASLRDTLPLHLFQIDDGYQRAWGDWLTLDTAKFPTKSMRDLVDQVRAEGLRPGLWLAPVAVDKHSQIAADHPEWIIRQVGSTWAANSANCGKWFYGLDVTIPEVQEFIRHTLTTVSHGDWSFDYLKLDFLYAAALKGTRKDPTKNTAQVLQMAMRLIRESVGPSTFVLGCGAPLGATIGWVNANRVSADAGPGWLPSFPLPDCKWNLPCGRNMVRNTISRMSMHGRWWVNDPDCMLLREATQFTSAEIIGIATVKALSGGSFLLSDDLGSVSAKRIRIAQALLPVTGKTAIAIDLLDREIPEILRLDMTKTMAGEEGEADGWVVVALCNWSDKKKDSMSLWEPLVRPLLLSGRVVPHPLGLHVLEFWSSEYSHVNLDLDHQPKASLRAVKVKPHSAKLFAIRIDRPKEVQYLGSDVHFSCGYELIRFEWAVATTSSTASLTAVEDSKRREEGERLIEVWVAIDAGKIVEGGLHHIWLSLPGSGSAASSLEGALGAQRVEARRTVWKIPLSGLTQKVFEWHIVYKFHAD